MSACASHTSAKRQNCSELWRGLSRLVLLLLGTACSLPSNVPTGDYTCSTLRTPSGPEDMVFDQSGNGRLLLSIQSSPNQSMTDDIYEVRLNTHSIAKMVRRNGPDEIHPRGIDLVKSERGSLLYVVDSQKKSNPGDQNSRILIYEIADSELLFKSEIPLCEVTDSNLQCMQHISSALANPNDVTATLDGVVYVTNRVQGGDWKTIWEALTDDYSGSVYRYTQKTGLVQFKKGLAQPNGITLTSNNHLAVALSGSNNIVVYDLNETQAPLRQNVAIPTPDNFSLNGSPLLLASHTSKMAFILHAIVHSISSPWAIFEIDETGDAWITKPIHGNDGSLMSAASVAIRAGHNLFIGQVFKDFILTCERSNKPNG